MVLPFPRSYSTESSNLCAWRAIERAQSRIGLGLILVNKVLEAHNGDAQATNYGVGRGSVFRVRLPRNMLHPVSETTFAEQQTQGTRLLVGEDNDGIRKMLRGPSTQGFDLHLTKPVDSVKLLLAIQNYQLDTNRGSPMPLNQLETR